MDRDLDQSRVLLPAMRNGLKRPLASRIVPVAYVLSILGTTTAAAAWRFWPWMPQVFFGDDLSNLLAYRDGLFASTLTQCLGAAAVEKYRPVFACAMWISFHAFGHRIVPFLLLNVLLHGIAAFLVFAIASRLTQRNTIASLAVALSIAASRFALYQVTQVTGLLEGLAFTLFLAMLYCIIRAADDSTTSGVSTWRWSSLAVLAAFLTCHTHERYIVVVPWLCCAIVLLPGARRLSRARVALLVIGCFAGLAFNIVYKALVLRMPLFVGTGGTHITLTPQTIKTHLTQALLSLFGFNEGPQYLVGASLRTMGNGLAWALAGVFALVWTLTVVSGIRASIRGASVPSWGRWPLLSIALIGLLLLPPVLTIRLEQRWLLEPFTLLLFLFAWALGGCRARSWARWTWACAPAIALASIGLDSVIARDFDRIFFVYSGRFASLVSRDIASREPGNASDLALGAAVEHCDWTLLQGRFFRIYGGRSRHLRCSTKQQELRELAARPDVRIYVLSSPTELVEVGQMWRAQAGLDEKVLFDFIEAFAKGHISDSRNVATPTGKGAFSTKWDSVLGETPALIVLTDFSYRYDAVPIDQKAYLRFGVSMIFPTREPARAIVRIAEEGANRDRILFARVLTPPQAGAKVAFQPVSIPLGDYTGKRVALTFGVETPGSDCSGHWVGFAEPRIVGHD